MKIKLLILTIVLFVSIGLLNLFISFNKTFISGAPPYGESEDQIPDLDPYAFLRYWRRPDGSPRVGLQAGHWKSHEVPEELKRLRSNTGASAGEKTEWELNLEIAQETKKILEDKGVVVDILPATIPPSYWADVFLSIHSDGHTNSNISGFKVASSWRDLNGKAEKLVQLIEKSYEKSTNFSKDSNISRNMRGYYAFSWWRYDHAVHPMTTSAIIETGFITNPENRKLLIDSPNIPAKGIAEGIIDFLESESLLNG